MRSCGLLILALAGCRASPPNDLAAVPNKQVSFILDFNPPVATPPIPAPALVAFFQFDQYTVDCPAFDVTASLDDAMLTPSTSLTGSSGNACILAFALEPAPASDAAQSTLRFVDTRGNSAAYTSARLLEPRAIGTNVAAGSVVHAGDTLSFGWPVASDIINSVGGAFLSGTTQQPATASFAGTTAAVIVPALTPGSWTLRVDVIATPALVACTGAQGCAGMVRANTRIDLTVQ